MRQATDKRQRYVACRTATDTETKTHAIKRAIEAGGKAVCGGQQSVYV